MRPPRTEEAQRVAADAYSAKLFWDLTISDAPQPAGNVLHAWVQYYGLPNVLDVIERAQRRSGFDGPDHLYKWLSATLRNGQRREVQCPAAASA